MELNADTNNSDWLKEHNITETQAESTKITETQAESTK
jgi:hypothetical protein